ncbi:hypothetical protein D3C77_475580 [compost metagenome]
MSDQSQYNENPPIKIIPGIKSKASSLTFVEGASVVDLFFIVMPIERAVAGSEAVEANAK